MKCRIPEVLHPANPAAQSERVVYEKIVMDNGTEYENVFAVQNVAGTDVTGTGGLIVESGNEVIWLNAAHLYSVHFSKLDMKEGIIQ